MVNSLARPPRQEGWKEGYNSEGTWEEGQLTNQRSFSEGKEEGCPSREAAYLWKSLSSKAGRKSVQRSAS